jgi:predicted MFS family arabinose efflux permease
MIGCILQASAVKLSMMLVGRIVSGFAIGMMSVGATVYLTECAYRKATTFYNFAFAFGGKLLIRRLTC